MVAIEAAGMGEIPVLAYFTEHNGTVKMGWRSAFAAGWYWSMIFT